MQPQQHVYYASYGSNLNKDRFYSYLTGKKYSTALVTHKGCENATEPKNIVNFCAPQMSLYFAQESTFWGSGGVGFVQLAQHSDEFVHMRMYLITQEQFCDIVAQENGAHDEYEQIRSQLLPIMQQLHSSGTRKMHRVLPTGAWYNALLYLGTAEDGHAIFSFTTFDSFEHLIQAPCKNYLQVIAQGLRDAGMSKVECAEYLLKKRGMHGKLEQFIHEVFE